MPGEPPAAANASGSREAGQPGDGIHCDEGARLARSDRPRSRSSSDGCWRGRRCSGGRRTVELGVEVPGDRAAATHAGVFREAGRPGDGIHFDDGERLARSGLPRARSSGDGYWQGRGSSGGRSARELGTEAIGGPTAATHVHGAFVPTGQGNSLHPCSPSAMRAHLGGVWQPRGCSGGRSAEELGTEVPGSPLVAREDDFEGVDCAAEEELVQQWQLREEGWDSVTVLD